MIPEVLVTQNETASNAPNRWGAQSLNEEHPVVFDQHSRLLSYRLDGTTGNQSVQAYSSRESVTQALSTVEGSPWKDHGCSVRIVCRPQLDSVYQPIEYSEILDQYLPIHLGKPPFLNLMGSYRDGVSVRMSDGEAMIVVGIMEESRPANLSRVMGMPVEASSHAIEQSTSRGLTGRHSQSSIMDSVLSDPIDMAPELWATGGQWYINSGEPSTAVLPSLNIPFQVKDGRLIFTNRQIGNVASANPPSESLPHPIVQSFAEGFADEIPLPTTLETAAWIVEEAIRRTSEREIGVDDTDGSLSFELRQASGLLIVGELSVGGNLHVNVYNDRHPNPNAEVEEIWLKYLPHASVAELNGLF